MHTKYSRDSLFLALGRVINVRTGFKHARIRTEEREFAYERVGHNLERESAERFVVGRLSLDNVAVGIGSFHRADIYRAGEVIHDGVEKILNSLVLIGRPAKNGSNLHGKGSFTQSFFDVFDGKVALLEIFFHKRVVLLCGEFDDLASVLFDHIFHVFGNFRNLNFFTEVVEI